MCPPTDTYNKLFHLFIHLFYSSSLLSISVHALREATRVLRCYNWLRLVGGEIWQGESDHAVAFNQHTW